MGDENFRDGGRTADGIRLGGGRNPIGRRTESDRTADGIRSDGGRSTMTEVEVLGYIGGVMGVYILCYGVIYIILWSCIYYAMGLYIL